MKLFILALALVSTSAFALPVAPFDALKIENFKARNQLEAEGYDFEGIVKLSNCSGSLVIFHGMPFTAKAIVMTNGHCIQKPGGYLNPGEVWVDKANSREMKIFDKKMKLFPIKATKILFATMTNTDLAFYELAQTYLEITNTTSVHPFIWILSVQLLVNQLKLSLATGTVVIHVKLKTLCSKLKKANGHG